MRRILTGLAAFTLLLAACEKDKDLTNATIIDTGDVSSEGCGYLLRMDDGREEKPVYLDSDFQHDGLRVKVKFHLSGIGDTCGFRAPRSYFEQVYIDEIKRDN